MNRAFWLQLLGISVLFTTLSATVSFVIFRSASAPVSQESRRNVYLFLANILESAPYPEAMQRYEHFHADSPTIGRTIWVLSPDGTVYASNTREAPPPEWRQMSKPQHRHEFSTRIPGWGYFADLILVRLDKPEPTYLLVRPEKDTPNKALAGVEFSIFILALVGTSFAGATMIVVYVRRTSKEARRVMARLHEGDLQARFPIRKFDEIGNLKLDFNAMADEIERLVVRLRDTESARRNLLKELSHDLRTPLTSLRTSIDTLAYCRQQMSAEQQQEFLHVAQSELEYFVRLLEDLFLIADFAEPGYKSTPESTDLRSIANAELHARQVAQPTLNWSLHCEASADVNIECDRHLILRLLRNALDNAGKYANSRVDITLTAQSDAVQIDIADDGPGIEPEALKSFGERRKHRLHSGAAQSDLSLGLGSVIMKAIANLHGGTVQIAVRNGGATHVTATHVTGTVLTCKLPRRFRLESGDGMV